MPLIIKDFRLLITGVLLATLAACQTAPPPPPAPVVQPQYTPRAPTPPFRASVTTIVPIVRSDGLRQTINRDIGPLETVWHVRAALNVAALSCTDVRYNRIIDDYNSFLKNNKNSLRKANNAIISKYRREQGGSYKTIHDRHQTTLYNYWSFSPLRTEFCDQAAQIAQRAIDSKLVDIEGFAAQALIDLEKPFNEFYLAFEKYERDLEAWRVKYGNPRTGG